MNRECEKGCPLQFCEIRLSLTHPKIPPHASDIEEFFFFYKNSHISISCSLHFNLLHFKGNGNTSTESRCLMREKIHTENGFNWAIRTKTLCVT